MIKFGARPVSSATIIAGLGYTPVNKAGDTMTGQLFVNSHIVAGAGNNIGWNGRTSLSSPADGSLQISNNTSSQIATLAVEANNVLVQRGGVSPQTFNIYNTFTDASNYERGTIRFLANVFDITVQSAGTGLGRDLRVGGSTFLQFENGSGSAVLQRGASSAATIFNVTTTGAWSSTAMLFARLTPNINQASGTYTVLDINPTETGIGAGPHKLVRGRIGAGGDVFYLDNAGRLFMAESADPAAPAANNGVVYMRDNGSGKTQLVARFPTGAVQVIATEP